MTTNTRSSSITDTWKRRKRNPWAPWQVVYVTGRIRGLLARTKLVRGRKRREWLTRSENLQGWRECQRGMTTSPPFMFSLHICLLTEYLDICMHTSKMWLKVRLRLFSGLFVAYCIRIKRFLQIAMGKNGTEYLNAKSCTIKKSVAYICIHILQFYFTARLICNQCC